MLAAIAMGLVRRRSLWTLLVRAWSVAVASVTIMGCGDRELTNLLTCTQSGWKLDF